MIILKDNTQALLATTVSGLSAPTRKGYSYVKGTGGTTITASPDGTISVGDWIVMVVTTYNLITITDPAGWTILQPQTTSGSGTLVTAIYAKIRASGDTSYTVTISGGAASTDITLMWGSGSDAINNWVIGANTLRSVSTQNTAASITTTTDHTLVLAISTERTTADESAIVSMTGAQQWFFQHQDPAAIDIQTTVVGVMRDITPAGATPAVVVTYPNPQGNNGMAIQIGIPPSKAVSIDSSATYLDITPTGTTPSSYETKNPTGVGTTLYGMEKPLNENTPADTSQVELGTHLTAYVSGVVTALRYYKGVGSGGGTKVGHLWANDGTLLATATFVNETASGWQTQALTTPVALTGGLDYVVSYYAPNGNYANTPNYYADIKYFGPLASASYQNGLYGYGPSGTFPTGSFNHTAYFADVVFVTDSQTATTVVLPQPTSSVTRELKELSLVNTGAITTSISVTKIQLSASYKQTPPTLLAPGEMLQYDNKAGWRVFASDGTPKANLALPATKTTQITANTNNQIDSSADLQWIRSQDTLSIAGANNPQIQLNAVAATPAVPPSSTLALFAQHTGGKIQLMKQGHGGDSEATQAALWQNNFMSWTPSLNVGTWIGGTGINIGSAVQVAPTSTNSYTVMRRSTFATAAGANTQAGLRSEGMYYMGLDPGIGGFYFTCRFGFENINAGGRAFVGMINSATTNMVTNEPSSLANLCGFGFDSTDSGWFFIHNDGVGTASKEPIGGQGVLATNNTGYDAYIWNPSGTNAVYYRLDRTDTGATIAEGSVTGDVPVGNLLLMAAVHCGNGTNVNAGDVTIGINRLYVETNR